MTRWSSGQVAIVPAGVFSPPPPVEEGQRGVSRSPPSRADRSPSSSTITLINALGDKSPFLLCIFGCGCTGRGGKQVCIAKIDAWRTGDDTGKSSVAWLCFRQIPTHLYSFCFAGLGWEGVKVKQATNRVPGSRIIVHDYAPTWTLTVGPAARSQTQPLSRFDIFITARA